MNYETMINQAIATVKALKEQRADEAIKGMPLDDDNLIEVECDCCGAILGVADADDTTIDEGLNLCHNNGCCADGCTTERLEQVDPVKYATLIAHRKAQEAADYAVDGYTNAGCISCVHDSGEGCNWTANEDIPLGCYRKDEYEKEIQANIAGGYWYDEDNRPVEPKIVPVAKPCAKCIHPELQNCDACIPF